MSDSSRLFTADSSIVVAKSPGTIMTSCEKRLYQEKSALYRVSSSTKYGYFRIYKENKYLYQYDNARYYTSQQTQTKLRGLGVKLLEWSAKSLHCNIIEYLWSIIDDK